MDTDTDTDTDTHTHIHVTDTDTDTDADTGDVTNTWANADTTANLDTRVFADGTRLQTPVPRHLDASPVFTFTATRFATPLSTMSQPDTESMALPAPFTGVIWITSTVCSRTLAPAGSRSGEGVTLPRRRGAVLRRRQRRLLNTVFWAKRGEEDAFPYFLKSSLLEGGGRHGQAAARSADGRPLTASARLVVWTDSQTTVLLDQCVRCVVWLRHTFLDILTLLARPWCEAQGRHGGGAVLQGVPQHGVGGEPRRRCTPSGVALGSVRTPCARVPYRRRRHRGDLGGHGGGNRGGGRGRRRSGGLGCPSERRIAVSPLGVTFCFVSSRISCHQKGTHMRTHFTRP